MVSAAYCELRFCATLVQTSWNCSGVIFFQNFHVFSPVGTVKGFGLREFAMSVVASAKPLGVISCLQFQCLLVVWQT